MMEYKGYPAKIELDAEAGVFHGQVFGLRDVVTFQGTTVEDVRQAFRDSVDDYLDFCRERGEEPERPFSGRFVVRIDPELHRMLVRIAQAHDVSLNVLIDRALTRVVKEGLPEAPLEKTSPGKAGRSRRATQATLAGKPLPGRRPAKAAHRKPHSPRAGKGKSSSSTERPLN